MNTYLLLSFLTGSVVGITITWIYIKSKFTSDVAKLQAELMATQSNLSKASSENSQIKYELDNTRSALSLGNEEKAALVRQVELMSSSLVESKQLVLSKEDTLRLLQEELNKAIESKAIAESQTQQYKARIKELDDTTSAHKGEMQRLSSDLSKVKEENSKLTALHDAVTKQVEEQRLFLEKAEKSLKDAFGALSLEALKNNNATFVELAQTKLQEKVTEAKGEFEKKEQAIGELVKPLSASLEKMDTKIQEIEDKRIRAYSDVWNYLDQVKTTTEGLKKETSNLVGALKTSHQRGRYGRSLLKGWWNMQECSSIVISKSK
jgi:DNA recombination protein RmuC